MKSFQQNEWIKSKSGEIIWDVNKVREIWLKYLYKNVSSIQAVELNESYKW